MICKRLRIKSYQKQGDQLCVLTAMLYCGTLSNASHQDDVTSWSLEPVTVHGKVDFADTIKLRIEMRRLFWIIWMGPMWLQGPYKRGRVVRVRLTMMWWKKQETERKIWRCYIVGFEDRK